MSTDPLFDLPSLSIAADVIIGLAVLAGLVLVSGRLERSDGGGRRSLVIIGVVLMGWFAAAYSLAISGVFVTAFGGPIPPNIIYGIWLPVLLGVPYIAYSKTFARILDAVPQHWLIGIQVYRVLGIIFIGLYAQGKLPGMFALPAGWGDVLVGVLAPLAAYASVKGARRSVLGWNILGLGDLVLAVSLGFLSSPGQFQQISFDFPNQLIGMFPLVMIPVFAVPLSILLHACSLRKLARDAKQLRAAVA